MNNNSKSPNIMEKIAKFIVDKRKGFYLLFAIALIYAIVSIPKVKINDDISTYLPDSTETRVGVNIMDEEFKTFGHAQIMISNISYEEAKKIANHIENMPHVFRISFENTEKYYIDSSALIIVNFDNVEDDPGVLACMQNIKNYIKDYDVYIVSEVGDDYSSVLDGEVRVILMISSLIIVAVLIFTSKSYLEILVFLIVFIVAAILNMGTNYWFGEISFVTKSVAIILQLALAVDYAIILCHRFTEEMEHNDPYNSIVKSLSKAIIEISSSSLTTIAGLFALTTMQFGIGMDMGVILIKGIIFSLITVFLLMPGLLLMLSKGIIKTSHKNFVPDISIFGKLVVRSKYILIPVFIVVFFIGGYLSMKTEYAFSKKYVDTENKSVNRISQDKIDSTFGTKNNIAIIVPKGNYEYEKQIVEQLKQLPSVVECVALSNTEAEEDDQNEEETNNPKDIEKNDTSDIVITDKVTARQFAELTDVDIDLSRLLFTAYGISNEEYTSIFSNVDEYSVSLMDMFDYVKDEINKGVISLEDDQQADFDDIDEKLEKARTQLSGEKYSRIVVVADVIDESQETTELIKTIRKISHKYYDKVILAGEPTVARDLKDSFSEDNVKISIITALFVIIILLFTFRSIGLPFMLILTIQGSIFINFSFPYITNTNLFFLSYLIVSAIQMGATIDYAILITNRYQTLKQNMNRDEATVEALNQAFPTIFTSGTILTTAGYLIGHLSTHPVISSIGLTLGRGTLISIILVLTVLPQILNIGDYIIEKSAITINVKKLDRVKSDEINLEGYIKGEVHGYIDGELKGSIKGQIDALLQSSETKSISQDIEKNGVNKDEK